MTEKEASARVEQAAHEGGLQEDLLWANDVRDEEQQRAVDQFLTDCVQVSEDVTLHQDPSLANIFAGHRHSAARSVLNRFEYVECFSRSPIQV